MNKHAHALLSLLLALLLAVGSFTLVGCSGSDAEQDNCYGEDMPVVNE